MTSENLQPWERLIKCGPRDNEEIAQAGELAREIEKTELKRHGNKKKPELSSLADGINEQRRQLFHRMGIR